MSEIAQLIIAREEGFRDKPYLCSEGFPTVGYGQKIGTKGADISLYKFTIPQDVAELWMLHNIDSMIDAMEVDEDISAALESCNEVQEAVLVSMCYQMGVKGLSSFKRMLSAIEFGDFREAAREALDSRWRIQTPDRCERHAEMLETGALLKYYE